MESEGWKKKAGRLTSDDACCRRAHTTLVVDSSPVHTHTHTHTHDIHVTEYDSVSQDV